MSRGGLKHCTQRLTLWARNITKEGILTLAMQIDVGNPLGNIASICGEHIRIEDNAISPVAKRALPPSHKAAIPGEMSSRRQLGP